MKAIHLLLIILLCENALAFGVPVLESDFQRHLGDEIRDEWGIYAHHQGISYKDYFYLEYGFRKVWIELKVRELYSDRNEINVNNVTVSNFCYPPKVMDGVWAICNFTLPQDSVFVGRNSIELISGHTQQTLGYDDILIKDLKIYADYRFNTAHIQALKTLDSHYTKPGEPVKVTLSFTNLGSKNAYNISYSDNKPANANLVSGDLIGFKRLISPGDLLIVSYGLSGDERGIYSSWPGKFSYYLSNGSKKEYTLEETWFEVEQANPNIVLSKQYSPDKVLPNQQVNVTIKLINNGTVDAIDLILFDPLASGFNISDGTNSLTLDILPKNSSYTHSYVIYSINESHYMGAASLKYLVDDLNEFELISNYASVSSLDHVEYAKRGGDMTPLIIIFGVVLVLAIVLIHLRNR
jgi:uncharacterized repeat protein (TIGR01451 family)